MKEKNRIMNNYKYSISKKIVKHPMRFVEHITISNSEEDFVLSKLEKVDSFSDILNILLISIGVVIILLGIAILIRLK